MSKKNVPTTATARLKQDYMRLKKDPIPFITAEPITSNILEWHYIVRGPKDTPYYGGIYHGKLVFPREFPFKPPSIYMITPNGRFETNTRLCLSISDFHPDTWNPAWSVGTILTGLLSFMVEDTITYGSIKSTHYTRKQFAWTSGKFNLNNSTFCELFPDVADEIKLTLQKNNQDSTTHQSTATNAEISQPNSNFSTTAMIGVVILGFAIVQLINSMS